MSVNLNNCKIGDLLRVRSGEIVTYAGQTTDSEFRHSIRYQDGRSGTRRCDGRVLKFIEVEDIDVVHILDEQEKLLALLAMTPIINPTEGQQT